MASFIQLLVSGLATGAIYALVAVGFTLLWQTSQTINFAQGEFVMVPAFFALIAMQGLGAPFLLALLLSILASLLLLGVALFGIGLLGEYVGRIYQQVRERPRYVLQAILEPDDDAAPRSEEQGRGLHPAASHSV